MVRRAPKNQLAFRLHPKAHLLEKWIIDLFCGGGGASRGMERALGRSPNLCVNHWPVAIRTHEANHPASRHETGNVWEVDPRTATQGHPVGLLWASPDCTYFSRAKGAKPIRHPGKRVRILADVVVKWARDVRPDVIMMENVMELQKWGPLQILRDAHGNPVRDKEGRLVWLPNKDREGEYFDRWVRSLRRLGYQVEWRQLKCSEYGSPTSRKRLFIVARCDGQPIRWPAKTHGPGLLPERIVADCINWNYTCPSIFERKKELAKATKHRVARAALAYVIDPRKRYLVNFTHGGRLEDAAQPARTITGANRGEKGVIQPRAAAIMTNNTGHRGQDLYRPLHTIVSDQHHALVEGKLSAAAIARIGQANGNGSYINPVTDPATTITTKAEHCLVAGTLIRTGNGERKGQAPRVEDLRKPITTLMADGQKHALGVAIVKNYGGVVGHEAARPVGAITGTDHHSLLAANLSKFYGTGGGAAAGEPCPTITAGGHKGGNTHLALGTATIVHYYSSGGQAQGAGEPIHAIVGKDRHALLTARLGNDLAGAIRVGAFLVEYGQAAPTAFLEVDGHRHPIFVIDVDGVDYLLVDLGLRMLQPDELKLAQGFEPDYILLGTKSQQVKLIGNSVPPDAAEALVRANLVTAATRAEAVA